MVSETIMNRIIPIVDIFGTIEGLEDFLKQFRDKTTKNTKETQEQWYNHIVEASKKKEEMYSKKLNDFLDSIEKEGYKVKRGKSRKLE